MRRLLFFSLIFLPNYLFAITVTWDGGGDEISWSDPINWSSNVVPDDCSKVIINSRIEVPTATKAKAYQIKTNAGKFFDLKLGAVLEVNSFN